ncbi:PREDICTED: ubiquinone biosynthesis protein COQ4 homolog, mitochondrial-like [Amphimedon queenslandica]|uniref:Ubiquinone biosynthesis protein COQ4 homolog, mitochondrial n=1 Tax=Amphimedon queenslandica TaxID=400682 RepID=A0A1X7V1R4_AMPQE|nr:PREDICTED: ubiquinone biosynthesis protein COQ4 homolog, mitochondrial-like [Amphimedon queenslandica]|eukprot:XP_019851046.1 PREDICTED: ubiquinone biosynthesis protein COQ4 homolog, mitochondrial-like [Amphimedon queenslandica]
MIIRRILTGCSSTCTVPLLFQSRSCSGNVSYGDKLYDSHVPTTSLQRLALTVGAGIGGLCKPERVDFIYTFGEVTGWYALQCMHQKMLKDETGQEILHEKPRLRSSTLNLEKLRTLPDKTLGREYVRFLDYYGYTPEGRASVRYVDDFELAYVMQRYREIHDFVHTLLQVPTSVYGEIVVKQFEGVQTGLPLCVLGGFIPPAVKLSYKEQVELLTVYGPWALSNGFQAKFLMNVYFEKHLEESLDELQQKLNIRPLPNGSLNSDIWTK